MTIMNEIVGESGEAGEGCLTLAIAGVLALVGLGALLLHMF